MAEGSIQFEDNYAQRSPRMIVKEFDMNSVVSRFTGIESNFMTTDYKRRA